MSAYRRSCIFLGATAALALSAPAPAAAGASDARRTELAPSASWTYQLQRIDLPALASTSCDILVIDYSSDGSAAGAFTAAQLVALKRKPDGGQRKVLAYLSVGEAEDYRFYWNPSWQATPPSWLKAENADWPGNFAVRFWDAGWQALIFGNDAAYLDRIMASGFDGVYLDRVDAFDTRDADLAKPARKQSMAAFVMALADYARARKPGFIFIAQNGEELLSDAGYLQAIDGLAKEDLFYGLDGDGKRNAATEIEASLEFIAPLRASAKPLFIAEYLADADQRANARASAAALGASLFIGERELDHAVSC